MDVLVTCKYEYGGRPLKTLTRAVDQHLPRYIHILLSLISKKLLLQVLKTIGILIIQFDFGHITATKLSLTTGNLSSMELH